MKKIIKKLLYDLNILSIPFYLCRIFKIKNNKIICSNFYGNGYGDSPKYICEELLKNKSRYDIVWVVKKNVPNEFPDGIRTVKVNSLKYIYELSTSKVWIFNCRKNRAIKKRKEQFYIQTWHGGIALKKIEKDAESKLDQNYILQAKEDSKAIDLIVSNGTFCTNMYKRAFWYEHEIIECGTPRNDALINADKCEIKEKICNYFDIPKDYKILLYAPTFRDKYIKNPYDINFDNIIKILNNEIGNKWKVLIRLHPKENCPDKFINFGKDVINATNYKDIQELILSCDMLITDYSSTMFEAMIANKQVILYANDIEEYNMERGLYFSFDELPFKLATNNEELKRILCEKNNNNEDRYNEFKKNIGLKEDGKASLKIAEIIERNIYG
jgi:CDP-glycerol glycerophosphotransferase